MTERRVWAPIERAMSSLHPQRNVIAMAVDGVVVLVCWHLTYLFRLGFEGYQPGRPWYDDLVSFGVVAAYLVCLAVVGVPRGIWRYFGFDDLKRLTLGCLMAGVISAAVISMAQLVAVARAVLVLHPLFCVAALSIMRMVYRMVWEQARAQVNGLHGEPRRAIVLGAGAAARRLVAGIHQHDGWAVLALLDDDPAKRGMRIDGVPVLGTLESVMLPHIVKEATHVIVAMPGATAEQRSRALELAKSTKLQVMEVPSLREMQTTTSVATD